MARDQASQVVAFHSNSAHFSYTARWFFQRFRPLASGDRYLGKRLCEKDDYYSLSKCQSARLKQLYILQFIDLGNTYASMGTIYSLNRNPE
ncbi:hypothetical protein C7B76_19765 [filamentous cyanobacterium CCP2]|nr:hypothetical protein C7B76_19765 [filamentous cyanobacterium CCP2]